MDLKIKTDTITVFEHGRTETECAVDGDFLLPDYCPDIAAVLKCTIAPAVLSRRQSGDSLLVDGQSTIRVLYLDEGRCVLHNFECMVPFTCSLPLLDADGNLPYVRLRVNYLNCRAVSPRRLDIHGALTAYHDGGKKQTVQVLSDISGEGVHTRYAALNGVVSARTAEKIFSISEVVDLGGNKPPAECILRTQSVPTVTTVKTLTDKVIVKGTVKLMTLYAVSSAQGNTCRTVHEFPFSQILDMEGAYEGMPCTVAADVLSENVHITPDQNGQGTLLAVALKICVCLDVKESEQMQVLTDAYTTRYPANTAMTRLAVETLQFTEQNTTALKEVLDMPGDNVSEIVDIWCEVVSVTTRQAEGCTYADGHLQICMPVRDTDGIIAYYEHVSDFSLQFDRPCDRMSVQVSLSDIGYAVVGNKIELHMELLTWCQGYVKTECTALQQFELQAEPYPTERAALRLCRVQKGESLWEIAKSCHTDVQAVMEENDITEDCVLQDCMLLVPLI